MADEQLRPSSRNLIDADLGPLRRFTGILDSMPTELKKAGELLTGGATRKRDQLQVTFRMKELEVKEAVEPYALPIWVSRPFTVSNRKKSRWGVLGESFNNLADSKLYTPEQLNPVLGDGSPNPNYIPPAKRVDMDYMIGKRVGLVLTDGEEGRPQPHDLFDGRANEGQGGDVPTATWEVYYIEGVGSTGVAQATPLDRAKELLDGKTLAQFNAAAMGDTMIRESDVLQAISLPPSAPTSFANIMVTSGEFTKDANEVYHKVKK